ncbi:hypothetical protein V5F49_11150 [Xanthobacter sp. V3C-3]|uniref:hypothetical protein n=1 Tax=Xanthobacter lutulentifluminis TaxID=3119935 RepID=UPI00372A9625
MKTDFDARYVTTKMGAAALVGLGGSAFSLLHAIAFTHLVAASVSLLTLSVCLLVVKDERRESRL